jgi:hypothetical protein
MSDKQVALATDIKWNAHWMIERYDEQGNLFNTSTFEKNGLANAGIDELLSLGMGTGAVKFDNANAYIGVGDDNTAFAAEQTDLQAVTNKLRKGMEATYPTYGSSQKATFKSSFGGAEANWHWQEFAVFNASTGGVMLNRKVSDQGTKTSGQTWVVTLEISLS